MLNRIIALLKEALRYVNNRYADKKERKKELQDILEDGNNAVDSGDVVGVKRFFMRMRNKG